MAPQSTTRELKMRNRALLSALAVCFIAAGCDSKPAATAQPKPAPAVTPLPPPAPQPPAASANQDATGGAVKLAQANDVPDPNAQPPFCNNGAHCEVEVSVTENGGRCTRIVKNPDRLRVWKGHAETIQFRMAAGSSWSLERIAFANPNAPFSCNGNGPINCSTPNNETTATEYRYVVHVKKGNVTCSADPMIVNGADNSTPP
jgi:hypothetical protein